MIAAASLNINGYSYVSTSDTRFGNSPPVQSNQGGMHPRLDEIVSKHLNTQPRNVISEHNLRAYDQLRETLQNSQLPLILDSFCGTGMSTSILSSAFADHLVVGIDKSAHRLHKHEANDCDNALLLRAECEPIWQMLARDGIRPDHHYLLYPNPWPKSQHLRRRIHGHPAFRYLVALGGTIELRSNWSIYVEEFNAAMRLAGCDGEIKRLPTDTAPISRFEKKLRASGHPLWRYRTVTNSSE